MILITRPYHLAIQTAQLLQEMNFESLIIPILDIRYLNKDLIDNDYNAIIITSQNAVLSCQHLEWMKSKKIYAVGQTTKQLLHQYGFSNVSLDPENCGDLQNLVSHITHVEPPGSHLLYLSGEDITEDLRTSAQLAQYKLSREIVYTTIAVTELSLASQKLIQDKVTIALFYSPRSALIFNQLVRKYNLDLSKKGAICISHNTSTPMNTLNWRGVYIAQAPNNSAMMQTLIDISTLY